MRIVSGVGAAFFGALLGFAVLSPATLERRAHDFVVAEVVERANAMLGPADSLASSAVLGRLSETLARRADSLRTSVDRGLASRLAEALAAACHYCPPVDSLESAISGVAERQAGVLQRASAVSLTWAQDQYSETVTGLVADLRVFTAVNTALFLLVLLAAVATTNHGGAAPQVILWLLLASTLMSILGYLFVQDWFYALVTGDFVGYGYAAWVGGIFLLLLDWVLNKGRITSLAMNAMGGMGG